MKSLFSNHTMHSHYFTVCCVSMYIQLERDDKGFFSNSQTVRALETQLFLVIFDLVDALLQAEQQSENRRMNNNNEIVKVCTRFDSKKKHNYHNATTNKSRRKQGANSIGLRNFYTSKNTQPFVSKQHLHRQCRVIPQGFYSINNQGRNIDEKNSKASKED